MSQRINLIIDTDLDEELTNKYPKQFHLRLKGLVQFHNGRKRTRIEQVIIDTGSAFTIIPKRLWRKLGYTPDFSDGIKRYGIINREECGFRVILERVECTLEDFKGNHGGFVNLLKKYW